MSYLICENRTEAQMLTEQANREKEQVLEEFSHYISTPGVIGIDIKPVMHTSGCWSVEADLTFDGEVVRHYEAYDLLVLDLLHWELAVLARNRVDTGKGENE